MSSSEVFRLVFGVLAGLALIPLLISIGRLMTVEVDDEDAVLVTSFGRLVRTLREPGMQWMPARMLPWVSLRTVSLRRDFRLFDDVHVNDARGTTLMVDLWLEFRIEDPAKAIFGVADWDRALQNLVSHAATSILGNREFSQILSDRTELGERLQQDISDETARWGLKIERVFIRNVKLLPEVSRQIFGTIARIKFVIRNKSFARIMTRDRGDLRIAEWPQRQHLSILCALLPDISIPADRTIRDRELHEFTLTHIPVRLL